MGTVSGGWAFLEAFPKTVLILHATKCCGVGNLLRACWEAVRKTVLNTAASKSDSVSLPSPDALQVGSEALERVAQALGARAALPQCRRLVREGLGGWTWQHQHAALSALGVLADGEWIDFAGWDGRLYVFIIIMLAILNNVYYK